VFGSSSDSMNVLPSSKPKRWHGFTFRIAVFATGAAAIVTIARLGCRPPLVWWTSPPIGKTNRHLRLLVPEGWELEQPIDPGQYDSDSGIKDNVIWSAHYRFLSVDRRPGLLRRLFPHTEEDAMLNVDIGQSRKWVALWATIPPKMYRNDSPAYPHCGARFIKSTDSRIIAEADYFRSNYSGPVATYGQICGSVKIE